MQPAAASFLTCLLTCSWGHQLQRQLTHVNRAGCVLRDGPDTRVVGAGVNGGGYATTRGEVLPHLSQL